MIETKIETAGIKEIRDKLGNLRQEAPTVLMRAINRTNSNIRKNMAKQASDRYRVEEADAKKTIKTRRASRSKLGGLVISRGSPIALSKFLVSPNTPVSYSGGKPSPDAYAASVKKGGALQKLDNKPKAFIAKMKNGHVGVYERTGKWGKVLSGNWERTREHKRSNKEKEHSHHNEIIKQRYGPSVPHMIKNEKSMAIIQEEARSTMQKRIDAEISRILAEGSKS